MTLVLLVVAGLLMQSLYRLRYADVGFRPDGVITLRTALPSDRYGTHARRTAFYDDVLGARHAACPVCSARATRRRSHWPGGARRQGSSSKAGRRHLIVSTTPIIGRSARTISR